MKHSAKKSTATIVITLPLIVNSAQEKQILARLEAGRRLYNATLSKMLKVQKLMRESKDWGATKNIKDKKLRSAEYNRLNKAYGFTSSATITYTRTLKNEAKWTKMIGSNVAQRIAEQVFAAVEQYGFGMRGRPRFKGMNRPLHSLSATTNETNLRWHKETGCIEFGDLMLPAIIPSVEQDEYLIDGLVNNRTKYCRILWRRIKGNYAWYAQLMQEGMQPIKRKSGKSVGIKSGKVGLDIGPSTVAVVGEDTASLIKFCDTIEQPWKATRRLQRAMDRSRRATNPQCFNENGTWKKGSKFTPSEKYTKLQAEYAETERKLAQERKCAHGKLTNDILHKVGNTIQTESLSYKSFQRNYGKSVKVRAPGMFINLLKRKAESAGGKVVELNTWKLKMSQYDHTTDTNTKKKLSQRWHTLGDGSGVVQRDIYSAFLAYCVNTSVKDNTHHLPTLEKEWAAQKPVLRQAGWWQNKPAKIKPLGEITMYQDIHVEDNCVGDTSVRSEYASELVACERVLAIDHGRDAVVAR